MGILRAIGLAVAIIVLKLLMPEVFEGLEATLIALFSALQDAIVTSGDVWKQGAAVSVPFYPHVPVPGNY